MMRSVAVRVAVLDHGPFGQFGGVLMRVSCQGGIPVAHLTQSQWGGGGHDE
jgi:hypothetical protein